MLRATKELIKSDLRAELSAVVDRELLAFEEALKSPEHRAALEKYFSRSKKKEADSN